MTLTYIEESAGVDGEWWRANLGAWYFSKEDAELARAGIARPHIEIRQTEIRVDGWMYSACGEKPVQE